MNIASTVGSSMGTERRPCRSVEGRKSICKRFGSGPKWVTCQACTWARGASTRLTWSLRSVRSPSRLKPASRRARWKVTASPSSRANAAVISTSDRQLPERAAKACAAVRVVALS